MSDTPLGAGAEFDLIRRLRDRLGPLARDIGDDAAVLQVPRGDLLVASTDAALDGVHFRREWLSAEEIAFRAVTAALSDLAAMGASPLGALVALALPEDALDAVDDIAAGIASAVTAAKTVVLGGNVARAASLGITTTVLGSAGTPLLRSGARPGDLLYVTGHLGGPWAAIRQLRAGTLPDPTLRARFARPEARIAEARWLATRGVVAAIDISDGLTADAGHLAAASGVAIELEAERIPVFPGTTSEDALGGEEYELLVASRIPLPVEEFAARFGLALTQIGRFAAGAARLHVTREGKRVATPSGYDHFSG